MTTEDVSDRIERGEPVRMEFGPGGRRWWMENPYATVSAEKIAALGNRLCEANDSLFPGIGLSQTWFASRD